MSDRSTWTGMRDIHEHHAHRGGLFGTGYVAQPVRESRHNQEVRQLVRRDVAKRQLKRLQEAQDAAEVRNWNTGRTVNWLRGEVCESSQTAADRRELANLFGRDFEPHGRPLVENNNGVPQNADDQLAWLLS